MPAATRRRDRLTHLWAAAAALAALLVPGSGYAAVGDLDPSFGSGGKFLQTAGAGNSGINAAVKQPDGKIVVAGFAEQSASEPHNLDFLGIAGDPKLWVTIIGATVIWSSG